MILLYIALLHLESGKLNREMDDDLIDFVKESGDKLIYLSTINDSGTSYAKEKRNSEKRIESEIRQHSDIAKKLFYKEPRLQSIVSIMEISLKTI